MYSILPTWSYCHRRWGSTQSGPADNLWASSLAVFGSCQINPSVAWDYILGVCVYSRGGQGCTTFGGGTGEMELQSLPAGLQFKMKAAAGWGIQLHAFPFLTSPYLFPTPYPSFINKLQFPEPTKGEWMRSLVMLWVNNLVRKLKDDSFEAMSWYISIAQLWPLPYC